MEYIIQTLQLRTVDEYSFYGTLDNLNIKFKSNKLQSAKEKCLEMKKQVKKNHKIRLIQCYHDETDENRKPCIVLL